MLQLIRTVDVVKLMQQDQTNRGRKRMEYRDNDDEDVGRSGSSWLGRRRRRLARYRQSGTVGRFVVKADHSLLSLLSVDPKLMNE